MELPPQLDDPQVPMRNPKPKRHPGDPTEAEIDAHNLTHANYRSWCAICNRAALKEDPHYRQTKKEINEGFPVVSFDYKTMGESEKDGDKITCLVGRDRCIGVTFAHINPALTHISSSEILLVIHTALCPGTAEVKLALAGPNHLIEGPAYVAPVVHRKALLGDHRGRQH